MVENHVLQRDKKCVYCGIVFSNLERRTKASWEHIVNDIRISGPDNIALCCMSCNASKGAKELKEWLNSDYCIRKEITANSVAEVVKNAITNPPQLNR